MTGEKPQIDAKSEPPPALSQAQLILREILQQEIPFSGCLKLVTACLKLVTACTLALFVSDLTSSGQLYLTQ